MLVLPYLLVLWLILLFYCMQFKFLIIQLKRLGYLLLLRFHEWLLLFWLQLPHSLFKAIYWKIHLLGTYDQEYSNEVNPQSIIGISRHPLSQTSQLVSNLIYDLGSILLARKGHRYSEYANVPSRGLLRSSGWGRGLALLLSAAYRLSYTWALSFWKLDLQIWWSIQLIRLVTHQVLH